MKRFIDTNVLVYAFDASAPEKRAIALRLGRELAERGEGVISTQVMQEVYSALTRKLGVTPVDARKAVRAAAHFEVVPSTSALVLEALDCAIAERLSIWDALIVTAAAAANCLELLSEDLNDGQVIKGVRVRNPFGGDRTR